MPKLSPIAYITSNPWRGTCDRGCVRSDQRADVREGIADAPNSRLLIVVHRMTRKSITIVPSVLMNQDPAVETEKGSVLLATKRLARALVASEASNFASPAKVASPIGAMSGGTGQVLDLKSTNSIEPEMAVTAAALGSTVRRQFQRPPRLAPKPGFATATDRAARHHARRVARGPGRGPADGADGSGSDNRTVAPDRFRAAHLEMLERVLCHDGSSGVDKA